MRIPDRSGAMKMSEKNVGTEKAERELPFTYLCTLSGLDENARRMKFAEFAANGAKHLVLSDGMLKLLAGEPKAYLNLRHEMRDAGLTFVDAHAPFGAECDPALPVPEYRRQMLARLKFNLQLVADFGVSSCCVHIDSTLYSGYTLAQHLDAARATLDEVLPVAEKLGVVICLENIFKPLNTVEDVLTLIREFPSPCLGACYDSGHANIMEHGMNDPECIAFDRFGKVGVPVPWEKDVLDRMLPHIVNCHLHDNRAVKDDHDLPGRGTVDWAETFAKLRTAPRLKCIQSEVAAVKHALPIKTLVETFGRLRK